VRRCAAARLSRDYRKGKSCIAGRGRVDARLNQIGLDFVSDVLGEDRSRSAGFQLLIGGPRVRRISVLRHYACPRHFQLFPV
jgi:hypothetical protein